MLAIRSGRFLVHVHPNIAHRSIVHRCRRPFFKALHSAVAGGTVFPELVTQGASWDVDLVRSIGAAIAAEASAIGIDLVFSPVINMWTDSRFGRLQEGYSENPTLTAAYARAVTVGFQGQQPPGVWDYFEPDKVVALGKHYAAYGAAIGGLNGAWNGRGWTSLLSMINRTPAQPDLTATPRPPGPRACHAMRTSRPAVRPDWCSPTVQHW